MGDSPSGDGLRLLRLIGDTPEMRELSVAEQRSQAVLAVISDGETVTEVAARFGVRRQTVHDWLAKYEAGGLENLGDRVASAEVVSASDGQRGGGRDRADPDRASGLGSAADRLRAGPGRPGGPTGGRCRVSRRSTGRWCG